MQTMSGNQPPKPGHSLGGSVRGGAWRDGGAGRGPAAQGADNGIVREVENKILLPQTTPPTMD